MPEVGGHEDGGEGQEEQAEGTGAYQTVNAEESGDVSSGSDWLTSPERSRQSPLPYDLQLEKDAVYQVFVRLALLSCVLYSFLASQCMSRILCRFSIVALKRAVLRGRPGWRGHLFSVHCFVHR